MKNQFYYNQISKDSNPYSLQNEWMTTLTAPQDGMWEAFMNFATLWEIRDKKGSIGYACVNDENCLLQFYLKPGKLDQGKIVFEQFIIDRKIQSAMIGTNNPIFLSLAMHFQRSITLHSYFFKDFLKTEVKKREGILKLAWPEDLNLSVDFYHLATGGPKEWLSVYLQNLIDRGELFLLERDEEILGSCEVRNSDSNSTISDIGMVVSPAHRKKGLGTFLLSKAKELAYDGGRKPICSCEKDNIGSLKSIHKSGFRSINQLLLFKF